MVQIYVDADASPVKDEVLRVADDEGIDAAAALKVPGVLKVVEIKGTAIPSAFEPLPGYKLNGQQTLGENIADLGGVLVALDAYRIEAVEQRLQGAMAATYQGGYRIAMIAASAPIA